MHQLGTRRQLVEADSERFKRNRAKGSMRYCPVATGARRGDQRIGAKFLRTYSNDVTLLDDKNEETAESLRQAA